MISKEHKELAKWAMKYALDKGCSDSRVSAYSRTNNSFEYRDTQIDQLEQSTESGMTIHLFVDGRYGSYSTNRLNKKELERYIANNVEATRFLAKDVFRKLPQPERYYKGDGKGLDIYDNHVDEVSVDDKIALIKSATAEVYGSDPRLISVTSGYGDGTSSSYMVASNGFEGESNSTYFSLSAGASMKGDGDARPSDYWNGLRTYCPQIRTGKNRFRRFPNVVGQYAGNPPSFAHHIGFER
jgi:PmbA protein